MSNEQRILVIGATSAIAQAAAREWGNRKARIFLVGRDGKRLDIVAADIEAHGGKAKVAVLDKFTDMKNAALVIDSAWKSWGGLDGVLIAHGCYPDQDEVADDPNAVKDALRINGESVCQMLAMLAPRFEVQGGGWIAAITSVAGDRGRKSSYVYGAGKAMVSHFLEGLHQRLYFAGVRVIDIRPGPVDTPMTAGKKPPLMADVNVVGRRVALACLKTNGVVYVPWFWRYIMLVLKHLPKKVWVRLNI